MDELAPRRKKWIQEAQRVGCHGCCTVLPKFPSGKSVFPISWRQSVHPMSPSFTGAACIQQCSAQGCNILPPCYSGDNSEGPPQAPRPRLLWAGLPSSSALSCSLSFLPTGTLSNQLHVHIAPSWSVLPRSQTWGWSTNKEKGTV